MISKDILLTFTEQFDSLKTVVTESSLRSIAEPPDPLFYTHQNVFIKSYLVSACSVLEAFIQELVTAYVEIIQQRINNSNLPFNFVVWIVDHEKARLDFKALEAKKNKKDIAALISPNYWKTMNAFERIGVDLSLSGVDRFKDKIASTVEKRNKIVHHNDEALDISYTDISDTIDNFKEYAECLFAAVCANAHLKI